MVSGEKMKRVCQCKNCLTTLLIEPCPLQELRNNQKRAIQYVLNGPDDLEAYKKMLNDILEDRFGA